MGYIPADSISKIYYFRVKLSAPSRRLPKIYTITIMSRQKKYLLQEDQIPTQWYNIQADMVNKPMPMLHPATREPMKAEDIYPIIH